MTMHDVRDEDRCRTAERRLYGKSWLIPGLLLCVPALLGQAPAEKDGKAAKARREKLLALHTHEAAGYTIYRDSGRKEPVTLRTEPVYSWTNPLRSNGQDGDVYVWTYHGRAEAIATFFSYPATGPRSLNHELHSLSLSVLDVARSGNNTWTPEAPGVTLADIPGAPPPARSAPLRLAQMRTLIREFSGTTEDDKERRWELRMLPKPLYRYESTDPAVLDGAVFAFVSTAGTDPEVILVIEARRPSPTAEPIWKFAVARFTDLNLWVKLKGKEVFSGPLIPYDSVQQDPQHRYRSFRDRGVPAVEEPEQP